MAGLMSLMGGAPRGRARVPGGDVGDVKHGKTFARYDGSTAPATKYFARGGAARSAGGLQRAGYFAEGGMADPEDHLPDVPPELKLAAYELLECLDSSRYSTPDGKSGRAEAVASKLLAFFRLADELPHEEGQHEPEEAGGEDFEEGEE